MAYWSATYLFQRGENPYSLDLMAAVQRDVVHSTLEATIMSWNPPFLFVFLLPLAWMTFGTAKFVWLLTNMILVLTAGLMLVQVYLSTAPSRVPLIFLMVVLGFPAVLAGLYMGQVTFLVFWGLAACVYLIKKNQWFWAGVSLILTTIKPHLMILSVAYLIVYMAKHRRWQGWIGLGVAGILCLTIILLFRPSLFFDLQGETLVARVPWATPTIGGLIGYLGFTEAARYLLLLFLPLPFVLVKRPERFSMEFSVALLTLITIPTTFFGWSYDQSILLIPIAQVFAWLPYSKYKLPVLVCIAGAFAINYYQRLLLINDTYYVWIPLFWWAIFGIVWKSVRTLDEQYAYSWG